MTNATLDATIRAYVFSEDESQDKIDDLIQDIEHVIYRIGDNSDKGIQEISILIYLRMRDYLHHTV